MISWLGGITNTDADENFDGMYGTGTQNNSKKGSVNLSSPTLLLSDGHLTEPSG